MVKGSHTTIRVFFLTLVITGVLSGLPPKVEARYRFSDFNATNPIHTDGVLSKTPIGMTPTEVRKVYSLPSGGGKGTIAIIGAYDAKDIEQDLADFNSQFNLSSCTIKNGCLTKHLMRKKEKSDAGWGMETALDVEWAHAIAPNAKILLVEAATPSGPNLLAAVDYAHREADVVAISMSWGGPEFADETSLDSHFVSNTGTVFFASSGDNGTGASWPASSPNVISVGGTTVLKSSNGYSESAWAGSGGGISAFEIAPQSQTDFGVPKANGMRAIPDVSYDADPASGFPVIHAGIWHRVGGTSAGAPQWAAIASLGSGITMSRLYKDKAGTDSTNYFRDITSGKNGDCGFICMAHKKYDFVTGLGSPKTAYF